MRRIVLIAVLAATGALVAPALATAEPGGGAVVERICPELGPAIIEGFEFTYCADEVQTPSGKANANFHGELTSTSPRPAPEKATTVTGFGCDTTYGITEDTRLVVTPSGQVNGTCKLH
jgi:hypothetical protein